MLLPDFIIPTILSILTIKAIWLGFHPNTNATDWHWDYLASSRHYVVVRYDGSELFKIDWWIIVFSIIFVESGWIVAIATSRMASIKQQHYWYRVIDFNFYCIRPFESEGLMRESLLQSTT